MVHKNYKWNVSKEKGRRIIFTLIETILKENAILIRLPTKKIDDKYRLIVYFDENRR